MESGTGRGRRGGRPAARGRWGDDAEAGDERHDVEQGRIERAFRMFQDRLVKEMRLRGVSDDRGGEQVPRLVSAPVQQEVQRRSARGGGPSQARPRGCRSLERPVGEDGPRAPQRLHHRPRPEAVSDTGSRARQDAYSRGAARRLDGDHAQEAGAEVQGDCRKAGTDETTCGRIVEAGAGARSSRGSSMARTYAARRLACGLIAPGWRIPGQYGRAETSEERSGPTSFSVRPPRGPREDALSTE
jgi:hypothetical protein